MGSVGIYKILVVSFLASLLIASGTKLKAMNYSQSDSLSTTQKVAKVLNATSNDEARQLAEAFNRYWNASNLSTDQKEKVEHILKFFEENNYKARPYYISLIDGLVGIREQNLPREDLDLHLKFIEDYIALEEPDKLKSYLNQTAALFKRSAIYYSSYYRLFFRGGSVNLHEELIEIVAEEEDTADDGWGGDDWGTDDGWGESDDGWGTDDSWGEDTWGSKMKEDDFFADDPQEEKEVDFTDPAPVLSGPMAKFRNVDLIFVSPFDSLVISNVDAEIALPGLSMIAKGGTIDWAGVGLPQEEVFAKLDKYHFKVNKPAFEADKVQLTYKGMFDGEVKGLLAYKMENKKADDRQYPSFISIRSNVRYTAWQKQKIDFVGGFAMEGNKISSASLLGRTSKMEVQAEKGKVLFAQGQHFTFEDSLILSNNVFTSVYHRRDSIHHPGARLNFDTRSRDLVLQKGEGRFKKSPFYSSFFNIYITADIIRWQVDSSFMDISLLNARQRLPAVFESVEYYDEYRYNSLSEAYRFNPLALVVNYANKSGRDIFYVDEMLKTVPQKLNETSVKGSMQLLQENGFIKYEPFSAQITVLDRARHYLISRQGKKDYDNMLIESVSPNAPNATYYMDKQEMLIRGVKEFNLNKKLGVSIKPKENEVIIKQNRDMAFDGTVLAGNYEYIGDSFLLDYDSFLIDMPKIERIKFNIEQKGKKRQGGERKTLENSLVETAGVLYINKPDNKSALRNYPNYPIFNATQGATVYFLGEEILDGVYDKSLYFVIPPFEIDSVSNSDPTTIAFEGTFHSGGIFPEFDEKLRVMPDNSLGFDHQLPEEGYEVYDGQGRIYGSLQLNNKGLQGKDKLEYLSTTLYAPTFIFFKDSLTANGTIAYTETGDHEGTSFPDVQMEDYRLKWLPNKDSMYIISKSKPFELYDQTASLNGQVVVNRKGLYGDGELVTRGSVTNSKRYRFREDQIAARKSDFIIESSDPKKPALSGDDVRLNFDLSRGLVEVAPEIQGRAAIDFPFAQYKTSIPSAQWNLAEQTVIMKKPPEANIRNSYFYSTHPDQDSLVFNATEAFYDIQLLQLKVSGIPYIISADAKIIPENNEALILADAEIQDFYNARLVIDTLNEYHRLFDGNIKILSRKRFEGNAVYRFVNAEKDTFNITMGDFELRPIESGGRKDSRLRTVSVGMVTADDWLEVSPNMFFKGEATMYADKQALQLSGYVKLDLKNIPGYDTWIAYESNGDQQQIILDFDNSRTEMGEKLTAGLHFEMGLNDLYATFANEKRSLADEDFFVPEGMLYFNQETNEFIIEQASKQEEGSYQGKLFAYNEQTAGVRFEGPLTFISEQSKDFSFMASGSGTGNLDRNEFSFNTMMLFNFSLPKQAIQMMGEDALEVIERLGAPEANKDFSVLLHKLAELIGDDATKAYEKRSFEAYTPLYMSARQLLTDLVLSNVDLKWSEGNAAWYSNGKIGLSHFANYDINAAIDGFVEIKKPIEGEVVTVFLQISPGAWYYFRYENNQLIFYSANDDINRVVQSKSKAGKAKVGQYFFQTSDIQDVRDFIREFRSVYYGINAPYFLEMAGSENYQAPALPTEGGWDADKVDDDDDDGF